MRGSVRAGAKLFSLDRASPREAWWGLSGGPGDTRADIRGALAGPLLPWPEPSGAAAFTLGDKAVREGTASSPGWAEADVALGCTGVSSWMSVSWKTGPCGCSP